MIYSLVCDDAFNGISCRYNSLYKPTCLHMQIKRRHALALQATCRSIHADTHLLPFALARYYIEGTKQLRWFAHEKHSKYATSITLGNLEVVRTPNGVDPFSVRDESTLRVKIKLPALRRLEARFFAPCSSVREGDPAFDTDALEYLDNVIKKWVIKVVGTESRKHRLELDIRKEFIRYGRRRGKILTKKEFVITICI